MSDEEILIDLLLKSFSSSYQLSQEERDENTKILVQLQTQPNTVFTTLQIIRNNHETQLKQAAIILLKAAIIKNWNSYFGLPQNAEYTQELKNQTINILLSEGNTLVFHNFVHAINKIMEKECDNWPQLYESIEILKSLEKAMYLETHMVAKIAPARLSQLLPYFIQQINQALSMNDHETVATACGLIAILLVHVDEQEEQPYLAEPLQTAMNVFYQSLSIDEKFARSISEKLSFAFLTVSQLPIPLDTILTQLFSMLSVNVLIPFEPITSLIKNIGGKMAALLPEIIQNTLESAIAVFDPDEYLDGNGSSIYILNAIAEAAGAMKQKVFFNKLLQSLSTETIPGIIISCIALNLVIPYATEVVTQNIGAICDFIITTINCDNICAKEIATDTIGEIAKLFEEGQNAKASTLISSLYQLLSSEDTYLVNRALRALRKLLNCCDIEVRFIPQVLEQLLVLFNAEFELGNVTDAISALIFSAGEDIVPYVSTLLPVVSSACNIDDTSDPSLKKNAIEALGNLVRFAPHALEADLASAIEIILNSGNTEDYDIRGSVMAAISNILVANIPGLETYASNIHELINMIINEEITSNPQQNDEELDDDDELDETDFVGNSSQINSLINTFLLIKNIYKRAPNLVPQDPSLWYTSAVGCMVSLTEDLTVAANLACTYICLRCHNDPSEFLAAVVSNFENDGPVVVGASFKSISRFLEFQNDEYQLPQEILTATIEAATKGLSNSLLCQEEFGFIEQGDEDEMVGSEELSLRMNIFRFFAQLATTRTDLFPVNKFLDARKKVKGNFIQSQYIGVLRQFYLNGAEHLYSLPKKVCIKSFIESIEICDFTVIPEPIIALRNVFEREPAVLNSNISVILSYIFQLVQSEYNGELHYWTTLTNSISFICSVYMTSPQTLDLDEWIPLILMILPVKGDEMEAEHIYSTLLTIVNTNQIDLSIYSEELTKVLAQTLGLKDTIIQSYHLTEQTYQGLVSTVLRLISSDAKLKAIVPTIFDSDELSYTRFTQRITPQE